MRRTLSETGIIIFFLILAAFVSAVGHPVMAEEPVHGGTLIFGTMGEPLGLDPGVIMDSESAQVAWPIFETLIRYDATRNVYVPLLAQTWKISPDRKIYTFYLRKNIRFHDGKPFNAGAVKFSWERQMFSAHPFHQTKYGEFIYYRSLWGGYPGNIKEIKILDDYTLQVGLYSRSYRFLKDISSLQFAIVSPHAVYQHKQDFHIHPSGTGPFKFVEWRPWQRIVLEGNREYWGKKPYLDRIVFEPAPGEKSRRRHMQRKRIDVMQNPTTDFLYNLRVKNRYPYLTTYTTPGHNFSFVSINCQKPPFNNSLVRKGINHAIDKERILRDINEDMPVSSSPFENLWGRKIAGRSYLLDHNKARSLFTQAGYPKGFEVELWYPQISRPYLVSPERVAKGVAQSLREVGLKVELRGMKWQTYQEKLRYGQHQLAITGIVGIDYDPDNYFEISWDRNNAIMGGTNISFYRNDKIHSILTATRFMADRSTRTAQYQDLQKILADDAVILPLYRQKMTVVMNKKVQGFQADKNGFVDFAKIWIKR